MERMVRRCLLLAALMFVVGIGEGSAQDNPSHKEIPTPKIDPLDLQQRFKKATEQAAFKQQVESLARDIEGSTRNKRELEEYLKANGPKLEELYRELQAGRGSENKLNDAQMRRLLETIQDIRKSLWNSEGRPTPTSINGQNLAQPALPQATQPQLDASEIQSRERFARWLTEQAKRLENVDAIKNSPTLQQARIDLDSYTKSKSLKDLQRFNLDKRLTDLGAKTLPEKLLSNLQLSLPRNISLPNLPKPNLPHVNLSWKPKAPPGLPSLVPPSVPSGGDASSLLWLAIVVVVAVLAWKLFRGYRPELVESIGKRLWAARWSVDPSAVMTRADLIRAFEHLSLAQLGVEARTWNHREIAVGLGGEEIERRRAADELADLYERARYAPESEPLPPEAMATARRALTHLAGVAAV